MKHNAVTRMRFRKLSAERAANLPVKAYFQKMADVWATSTGKSSSPRCGGGAQAPASIRRGLCLSAGLSHRGATQAAMWTSREMGEAG